jgi:hypothetical protein
MLTTLSFYRLKFYRNIVSFFDISLDIFKIRQWHGAVIAETAWPIKPKLLTICYLTEKTAKLWLTMCSSRRKNYEMERK